jgi:GntR family transcriptional regulator
MIADGRLIPGSRLPTEPELAKRLNVSRSTLRSALVRLAREGFIVRRRGIGTFVADKPLVMNNLNINEGVTDLIRSMEAEPGMVDLQVGIETSNSRVAKQLEVANETSIVFIERVRTADDKRLIFSRDFIPEKILNEAWSDFSLEKIEHYLKSKQSMYKFIMEKLRLQIHHGIAWLRPVTAGETIAEKLDIPQGVALFYIEQVDYGVNGKPLLLTDEYYVAEAFTFTIYRE